MARRGKPRPPAPVADLGVRRFGKAKDGLRDAVDAPLPGFTVPGLIAEAVMRRNELLKPDMDCFRIVNGDADRLPGITIDAFAVPELFVVNVYRDVTREQLREIAWGIHTVMSHSAIYVKYRPREARHDSNTRRGELAPDLPIDGDPIDSIAGTELGLKFLIRPAQGLSVGLYLDARDVRAWVRAHARGKTVLNTFAYTCGFGVAATAGGAARAVNLDVSRRVLDWGEENARLNGQAVERRDYISGDVFEWLPRLARKGDRFDLVILDPPSFATTQGSRFSAARDYADLVRLAEPLVAPKGTLLACCNLAQLPRARFESLALAGAAARAPRIVERLRAPELDFPGESALKAAVLALD